MARTSRLLNKTQNTAMEIPILLKSLPFTPSPPG
jgi:hypothetical protein